MKKDYNTYNKSGVNMAVTDELVNYISKISRKTYKKNAEKKSFKNIGSFGSIFDLSRLKMNNPIIVSSADGVGTKIEIANMLKKYNTIGIDLVAMCVNDLIVQGAKPIFFLDYIAINKLKLNKVKKILDGIVYGCKLAGCALLGGETAEMPDFYKPGDYDISGTIVGVVEKNEMMPNREVNKGDLLIGLPTTGLHTNGYSLARKVLLEPYDSDDFVDSLGKTIGEALLAIHKSYLPAIDGILHEKWLVGISHITGGGIMDNTRRILDDNQNLEINWNSWERPSIFNLIQELGNVPEDDMRHSMNLGIGMILIVKKEGLSTLQTHLASKGETYIQLGTVK